MMQHVEDLRANVGPTLRLKDPEKKSAREALAAGYPKLMRVHDAVRDHAGVKSWYAKV